MTQRVFLRPGEKQCILCGGEGWMPVSPRECRNLWYAGWSNRERCCYCGGSGKVQPEVCRFDPTAPTVDFPIYY